MMDRLVYQVNFFASVILSQQYEESIAMASIILGSMRFLLNFIGGYVATKLIIKLHECITEKEREEAQRMMIDEAMQHRNSYLADRKQINWAETHDSEDLMKFALSRILEKLCVAWIQEPAVFVAVEEDVKWIQRKLMHARVEYDYAPEELMDVAYDFEDVIDHLILLSASKQRRIGKLEKALLSISIHKKLKLIKSTIPSLPQLPYAIACGGTPFINFEEKVWSDIFLIHSPSLASAVVSPVEEKVSALLSQEGIHPCTKKKAMRVLDKLKSLKAFVQVLESAELDHSGMVWMEELSHVSLSAVAAIEDFINKAKLSKRRWTGPPREFLLAFGNFKSPGKLAVEMDKIYAKIQNLSIHKPKHVSRQSTQSTVPAPSRGIPPQPTSQEAELTSFNDDVNAMITRLLTDDKSFKLIPIMGMEGSGKTTLAKLIFNHKAVLDHFTFGAWTSDGFRFQLRKKEELLGSDLIQLGYAWNYPVESQRLKAFLISNRSLIVVDYTQFYYLDQVLEMLAETSNGSRMILTTRQTSVSSNFLTFSDPHLLRLRGDEESWALFTYALKINMPPQLLNLKGEIVRRCGGLPLLLVKLAKELSDKHAIQEWSTTLQQFHHGQQLWFDTLYSIHKDLSLYMRRCLFYFTLFPEDIDIPVRRLIALWVAEDLAQPEGENETPEDVAERCLNLLIAHGMVQLTKKKLNGNVKMVRLPDSLRQYWLSEAKQATFLGVRANTRSELSLGSSRVRRLVDHLDKEDISFNHIHGNSSINSASWTPYYEDVLSFLSFDTRKGGKPGDDVRNFLHRAISNSCLLSLVVLDLENVFRPKFPEAIGKMNRLRYLGLRSTFLERLPHCISKLQNVQTLDMKHTSIKVVPDSIFKLQQLRHLYLSENFQSKFVLQQGANFPTFLQTLCGLYIDEETQVSDGLDRLLLIRKLGFTMKSKHGAVPFQLQAAVDWILKLSQLRSLRIKYIDGNNQPLDLELKPLVILSNLSYIYLLGSLRNPSIMSQFPQSLMDLTLSGSGLMADPMQSLDKLPNLRSLRLLANSFLGKSMFCFSGGFRQLRVLKLWKLEQLEEWNVEEGALGALRYLEIRFCIRLKTLSEELQHRTLLNIEVTRAV